VVDLWGPDLCVIVADAVRPELATSFGGSFSPHGGVCSGFLAASAGVAKLIGLAVSSRT